jgi:hypothetical protein
MTWSGGYLLGAFTNVMSPASEVGDVLGVVMRQGSNEVGFSAAFGPKQPEKNLLFWTHLEATQV